MKKKFIEPDIKVIEISLSDVIQTSAPKNQPVNNPDDLTGGGWSDDF